jgi:DNA-binding response OmpR family regulator
MSYQLQVVIADNQTMDNIGYINYLTQHNMQVTYTDSLHQLKEVLLHSKVDILLFNLKQSDENGMDFLQSMGFQQTMGVFVFGN